MNIDGLNEHLVLLASFSWLVSVSVPAVSCDTSGPVGFRFCAVSASSSSRRVTQECPRTGELRVSRSLSAVARVKDGPKMVFITH